MKNKILYFDCFSGISGDMIVGAFVDTFKLKNKLNLFLKNLKISDASFKLNKVTKRGISATKFEVNNNKNKSKLYNYSDIIKFIKNKKINSKIKKLSLEIFEILGKAESKIHNIDISKIHFHEVGSHDSIIDVLAASYCIIESKVDQFYCSSIPFNKGKIKMSHGQYPSPGPATLEILKEFNFVDSNIDKELVTPTGAAILKAIISDKYFPDMNIKKIGYGAGSLNIHQPNVIRLLAGEKQTLKNNKIYEILTTIDDMNPELYTNFFKKIKLYNHFDVNLTQIIGKKNRPSIKLSITCEYKELDKIIDFIFSETTSTGLRVIENYRISSYKKFTTKKINNYNYKIKNSYFKNKQINSKIEYDDLEKLSKKLSLPLKKIIKILDE